MSYVMNGNYVIMTIWSEDTLLSIKRKKKQKEKKRKKKEREIRASILGKTGVAVPLAPILPLAVQNRVPWMRIKPRRPPISPSWASATGAANIAAPTRETKRNDLKAMVSMAVVILMQELVYKLNLDLEIEVIFESRHE